ncbi:MFS/sugar transport protein [Leptospira inadai serovar Lyme str. 10]|uniref:MFS/sugar transport protein n=2 Tax=Leptospira inadai serovar Lyme TaxID=293084 RepID=V6H9F1_9LEPT|nr:MFS transporter [Leptospira inadai]EQA35766.1 MFS/sugar transport protein [Leptospira inadai serovar Lyme str. 10]PNV76933.1 MFS transporter [Leptospira inadai serovar Lyme]
MLSKLNSKAKELTNGIKAGYASTEIGITAVETLAQIYLLEFYVLVVGLKPSLFGLAMLAAILWDAVSDPLMGAISDRTPSKMGRRRPYIIGGGLLLGVSVYFLFTPPIIESQIGKFLYLLGMYSLVNTFMTVLAVPHIALGGELSFEREERNKIFGWRLFFANLGLLSGLLLPAIFIGTGGGLFLSRSSSSMIVGIVLILTALLAFSVTKGRDIPLENLHIEKRRGTGFFHSFFSVIKNGFFLPLLFAFIIAALARTLNSSIGLLYYKQRLLLEDAQVVVRILLPFVFFLLVSIPLWLFLAKKYGKKRPAFWGSLGLGIMTVVSYPLFPIGSYTAPLIAAFVGGICAGSILLFDSLVADVVDYDELVTGDKKEGAYFGFWKMATKVVRALGLAFLGFILEAIGYREGAITQSPELGWRLTILFGPVVGSFFILSALVFMRMPLVDSKHKRIQTLLIRRRAFRTKMRLMREGRTRG